MGRRILLADDSHTIRKVVELTFADSDFQVIAVPNGDLALQKIRETRPDVILLDVIMPGKDGYDVCEFVKNDPDLSTIPVLLMAGSFEPFDRERAQRVGSDGFLSKPFDSRGLVSRVTELLEATKSATAAPPAAPPPAPPEAPIQAPLPPEPLELGDRAPEVTKEEAEATVIFPAFRQALPQEGIGFEDFAAAPSKVPAGVTPPPDAVPEASFADLADDIREWERSQARPTAPKPSEPAAPSRVPPTPVPPPRPPDVTRPVSAIPPRKGKEEEVPLWRTAPTPLSLEQPIRRPEPVRAPEAPPVQEVPPAVVLPPAPPVAEFPLLEIVEEPTPIIEEPSLSLDRPTPTIEEPSLSLDQPIPISEVTEEPELELGPEPLMTAEVSAAPPPPALGAEPIELVPEEEEPAFESLGQVPAAPVPEIAPQTYEPTFTIEEEAAMGAPMDAAGEPLSAAEEDILLTEEEAPAAEPILAGPSETVLEAPLPAEFPPFFEEKPAEEILGAEEQKVEEVVLPPEAAPVETAVVEEPPAASAVPAAAGPSPFLEAYMEAPANLDEVTERFAQSADEVPSPPPAPPAETKPPMEQLFPWMAAPEAQADEPAAEEPSPSPEEALSVAEPPEEPVIAQEAAPPPVEEIAEQPVAAAVAEAESFEWEAPQAAEAPAAAPVVEEAVAVEEPLFEAPPAEEPAEVAEEPAVAALPVEVPSTPVAAAAEEAPSPIAEAAAEVPLPMAARTSGLETVRDLYRGTPPAVRLDALPDDMIDAIAKRVVSMISATMIEQIAWEVVPDLAELLIKKEIERLQKGM